MNDPSVYPGDNKFEEASNNLHKTYKRANSIQNWVHKNLPRYSENEKGKIRDSMDKSIEASEEDRVD